MVVEPSFSMPLVPNVTDVVPPMKSPVIDPEPLMTAAHTPARFVESVTPPCAAKPPNLYPDAGELPSVMVVPEGHDIEKLEPESVAGVHVLLDASMLPPSDGLELNVTVGIAKLAVTVPDPDTVTVLPDKDTDPLVDQPVR
jgi:hypothetical protein